MNARFKFVVEGATKKEGDLILTLIANLIAFLGLEMAGGVTWEGEEESNEESEAVS